MLTVEQRVQRGIAYFDLFGPENWRALITTTYINMESVYDCPAGQVFGSYHNMPHRFVRADYGFTQSDREEMDYSDAVSDWYNLSGGENLPPYPVWGEALRDEWVKQLSV
jgi:hypothetical protein